MDRSWRGMAVGLAVTIGGSMPAGAAENLTVSIATFENGRVVIAGTAAPGAEVMVAGTSMADTADPVTGEFRITRRTVLPACSIDLEAGEAKASVEVANCRMALMGVEIPQAVVIFRPRGPWNSSRVYRTDDIVEFQGKTWRAAKDGRGRQPGLAGSDAHWTAFDPAAALAAATPASADFGPDGTAEETETEADAAIPVAN
jgi:hypothetical protein